MFPFNGVPAIVFLLLHARVAFLGLVGEASYKSLCSLASLVSNLLLSDLTEESISEQITQHETAFIAANDEFNTGIKSHVLHHVVECIRHLGSLVDLSCFWSER